MSSAHGEPATDAQVRTTVARLQTGDVDVAEECDLIWAAAREGEQDFLFQLAHELEHSEDMRKSPLGMIGAIGSLVTEIEQAVVSIPGPDAIETLFRFAELEQRNSLSHAPGRVDRRRLFASRVVLNQARNSVLEAMERSENEPSTEPLLFLLVQELIVQGYHRESPVLDRLHERMRAVGHPLGWLPLQLTELESPRADPRRTRTVHQYKVYTSKVRFPWGPWLAPGVVPGKKKLSRRGGAIRTWETTTGDERARLCAVVHNWRAESKARVEARTFAISEPVGDVDKGLLFRLHTCQALDLPPGPNDFHLERITPEQAHALLFHAAANGGELNEGCFGAYGRLRAWQSLGALAGCNDYASIDQVLARAWETGWFYFSAHSSWFYGLGEEFGLVALRPGGRSLALLAATDTD